MKQKNPPIVVVILDGWGIALPSAGNAITLAKTPVVTDLSTRFPMTQLSATGISVGLDDNQMSGSETGHSNIGAGRVVPQDSHIISESIQDGSFFKNEALCGAVEHIKKTGGKLHVMGLMSNADSPHSNPEHLRAILQLAKKSSIDQVYCHLFTDGRDSYPQSALDHLAKVRGMLAEEEIGTVATISGRFYAMDRSKNWDRLSKAYDALVFARGKYASSAEAAIHQAYQKQLTDEFILPTVIEDNGRPVARIEANDSVIFFNFRSDRARQFSKLFIAINNERIILDDMPIMDRIHNLYFLALTDFGPDLDIHTAFPSRILSSTLPMVLEYRSQLYIAEKEKFAHVTYFLNGGYADAVDGEDRVMVDSVKVDSYANAPRMSAKEVADGVLESIAKETHDFVVANFANADMVGHTGDLRATVEAIEWVDKQLGRIAKLVFEKEGILVVTSDHGNADEMIDFEVGLPHTFHTKNPVPFILAGKMFRGKKLSAGGVLGNIAPTILDVLGMSKPKVMTCESLIQ